MADISKITLPNNNSYTIKDDSAVANITRNGTTFTATRRNGTTFTFTQQDSDTTYSAGSGLSLSGTTFNHSNNVTAATAGTSSATSSINGTIAIPYVTYDSQGHITKSGTHTHTLTGYPEAYLTWGGKDFAASYGPIDAAMVPELGANRLAFIKGSAVTIEYSRDAGATWTDYGAGENANATLFGTGGNFYIGKADSTNKATANTNKYQLRVTIDTGAASVYTALNKFVIYISTGGSNSCTVQIQKALQSTPTTFVDVTEDVTISGWSGYNVINTSSITTYGNSASSQYGRIRFIFKANGGNTNYIGLAILRIMGFGGVGWTTPSNIAKNGHLYSYDNSQNATFPAKVTATEFNGTATNANKVNNHTVESNVPANAKFTDTTYTANTGIKLNGTVFQHTNSITAGTVGTSSATNGTTLAVPYVTYDAQGHITATGTHTHTITGFLTSSNVTTGDSVTVGTAFTVPNVTSVGSAPTLGTAIPADDITAWTTNTPTTITYTARSIPNVTAAGTASYASGGLTITNTTLGTAIAADDITAYTAGTAASLSYTAKSIPNVTSVGSAPTLGTAFTIPNISKKTVVTSIS